MWPETHPRRPCQKRGPRRLLAPAPRLTASGREYLSSTASKNARPLFGVVEEEASIPTRFENPGEVPPSVFEGLEVVQQLEQTSMLDHQADCLAWRLGF